MQNIMFMGFSLFELCYMFIFWSVVGWMLEVTFRTLESGVFESRGMLSGPYCPIYGFGVIFVVIASRPIQGNAAMLFFISMIICTGLELFVGIMLEKLFDTQWWNYSDYKYNFRGYIALKISLMWGAGCLIVVRIVHPAVLKLIDLIPELIGEITLAVIFILIFLDTYQTASCLLKFKRKLYQLDKLQAKLFEKTNAVGANLSDEVNEIKDKYERVAESAREKSAAFAESAKEKSAAFAESAKEKSSAFAESAKEKSSAFAESAKEKSSALLEKLETPEIVELRQKYEAALESARKRAERFLRAFPDASSRKRGKAFNAVKERFNKSKHKKN